MNKLIIKNYFFYLANLMLDILFPLLLSPYITRVLGAEKLGTINLANSISAWFVLIVAFGIPVYGIREVAKVKDDRRKLSLIFTELTIIRTILTIIGVIIFLALIASIGKMRNETNLYIAMVLNLLIYIFSVDWVFQGIEKYEYLTIRNLLFKTLMFFTTILLIKKSSQYVLYSYIQVISLGIFNLVNFITAKRKIGFTFTNLKIKKHFKKLKVFFIAALVTSIYTIFDSIVVGFMLDEVSLAFYTKSRQVINIGLTLTLSLSTVLIPRASYLYKNDKDEFNNTVIKSIKYILMVSIPMAVGIGILSKEIMFFFGGNEFLGGTRILFIMSFIIIFDPIYIWAINQVLIPTGNENKTLYVQIIMASINLTLNFILIYFIGVIGSAFSILITEIIGAIISIIIVKKSVFKETLKIQYIKYVISSLVMAGGVILIKQFINNYIIALLISGGSGVIIYFITLMILKDENLINTLLLLKRKVSVKKWTNSN
ncbi:MAG: oligosaccharide flippase family protein [Clostridium sp.]